MLSKLTTTITVNRLTSVGYASGVTVSESTDKFASRVPAPPDLPARGAWVVYFLECRDRTIYTGSTNDLARRMGQHQAGTGAKYTRSRLPVALLAWNGPFANRSAAARFEVKAQVLPRLKKLELIAYLQLHPGELVVHPYIYKDFR